MSMRSPVKFEEILRLRCAQEMVTVIVPSEKTANASCVILMVLPFR